MVTYQDIYDKIATTNNGKLLLCRFTKEELWVVAEMKSKNLLSPAGFFEFGDSVRVSSSNPMFKNI